MNLSHRLAPRLAAVRWTALLCVPGGGPGEPESEPLSTADRRCASPREGSQRRADEQTPGGKAGNARRALWLVQPCSRTSGLIRDIEAEMSGLLRITTKVTDSRLEVDVGSESDVP